MRRNLIIILAVIAVAVAAFFYFTKDEVIFSKETSLYKAVPLTAPVFVESVSLKALPLDNPLIAELSGIPTFNNEIERIKKIREVIKSEPEIYDNFNSRQVVLAFDFIGKNVLHPVIISSLKSSKEIAGLKVLIAKLTGVSQNSFKTRKYDGKKITEVIGNDGKSKLQYCVVGTLVIVSTEAILVEKCIRQLSAPGITSNGYFNQVNKTVTAQSKVSWYINHKYFPELWANYLNNKTKEHKNNLGETRKVNFKRDILKLKDYASWSELDFSISDNNIKLQGITAADDSLNHFLSVFKGQMPVFCNAEDILPRQTAFYIDAAFSDKNLFYKKLEDYYVHSDSYYKREEQFKKFDECFHCDSRDVFSSLVKDRVLAAITSVSVNNDKTESLFIISTEANDENRALFAGMIKSYAKHKKLDYNGLVSSYSTDNRKYSIYKFPFSSLPEIWLGNAWSIAKTNYAAFADDVLVFASTKQGLKNYLEDIEAGVSLKRNEGYAAFCSETDNKANLSIYANSDIIFSLRDVLFNKDISKDLKNNEKILSQFDYLGWQMISEDNIYFNSIVFGQKETETTSSGTNTKARHVKNARSLWQYDLGTTVSIKPQIVVNHHNKRAKEIIVQDANSRLHLIDANGKPVWKKPVPIKGNIMGKIHQVDYYHNGKLQYLFNTKEKIYLIDRLGRMVKNFPIYLKSSATNGVNVFDYDNNGKFRFFVACENKKVYAYNREGKIITGWKFGKTAGVVKNLVHHFRVNNKDYIVFKDETKVYIQNRRGETRLKFSADFKPSDNDVVLNTNGIPKIVVSDKKGTVYYLYFNGKYAEKETAKFSENHRFTVADINNDKKPEFIYADDRRLTVFKESGKKIFSEKFSKSLEGNIGIFSFSASQKLIGVTCRQDNKIYLFDSSGKECRGFPLQGDSDFSVGQLEKGQGINLLVGSRGLLLNYALQ